MSLFRRRREPLHVQLAREGGLALDAEEPIPPSWDAAGIHGNPRPREWDAVVTVDAPGLEGDRAAFVALPGGDLVVEEGPDDRRAARDRARAELAPPYRAEAVRREGTSGRSRGRKIEVVELPDVAGEEIELTVHRRRADPARRRRAQLRLDRRARASGARRARAADRRRPLGGRGGAALAPAPELNRASGKARYPVRWPVRRNTREGPSLRRRAADEAPGRSRPPTSRRSSRSSERSRTPSCARRRPSSGSGSRTASRSTTSCSRPTRPSARRACASRTSGCSTSS